MNFIKFFTVISAVIFLISCGQTGNLKNDNTTKAENMKLTKNTKSIDKQTTKIYQKKVTPTFDTGIKPTNSK